MILKLIFFLVFITISGQILAATDTVVCYYASWASRRPGLGRFNGSMIEGNLCTHVIYQYISITSEGTVKFVDVPVDLNDGGIRHIRSLRKKNPDLKVLLSVGGHRVSNEIFSRVASDSARRSTMAGAAMEFLLMYDFDGLDIVWEYPGPNDMQNYVDLLAQLNSNLKRHDRILSIGVNSIPAEVGGYNITAILTYADLINIRTNGFHEGWGPTAPNAPLYPGSFESAWAQENRNVDAAIQQWLDGGATPEKITLGIPFYGRGYKLLDPADNGVGATTDGLVEPGPYTGTWGTLGYNEICEFYGNGTVVFLDDMKVPYIYNGETWIGYDNEESVARKVQYAKEQNLAGVSIWTVDTDDTYGYCGEYYGLLKAVNKAIV